MASLFDAFLPVMAFVSLFGESPELHGRDFATVRADIDALIAAAREETRVIASRFARESEEALFAVCAFTDERLLLTPWQGRAQWMRSPLQYAHFQESNAGVVFYERLHALLQRKHRSRDQQAAGKPPALSTPQPPKQPLTPAAHPPSEHTGLPIAFRSEKSGHEAEGPAPLAAASPGGGGEAGTSGTRRLVVPARPDGGLGSVGLEVSLPSRYQPEAEPFDLAPPHADSLPAKLRARLLAAFRRKDEAPPLPGAPLSALPDKGRTAQFGGSPFAPREEALALFAVALTLGFTGRYHDAASREKLRDDTLASIDSALAGRIAGGGGLITPEAYYMPADTRPARRHAPLRGLLLYLAPPAVTAFIYLAYDSVLTTYLVHWLNTLTN